MTKNDRKIYGKYRGIVTDNDDPIALGRIRAKVPDVLGLNETSWAYPCLPYAGINEGIFFIPQIGSNVWIEFETGDPNSPIWVGGFWQESDTPETLKNLILLNKKFIKTKKCEIVFDDNNTPSGEITLKLLSGLGIILNDDKIEIDNKFFNLKLTHTEISINGQKFEIQS